MFADRIDAGRRLAERLLELRGQDVVVLGLSRGGVSVGFEVARVLGARLDVLAISRLSVPNLPQLSMGAIGEGGSRVLNAQVLQDADIEAATLAMVEQRERAELERRLVRWREGRPAVQLLGRVVVIVDEGIGSDSLADVGCALVTARGATRVVVATPVGATEPLAALRRCADAVVCLEPVTGLGPISQWYGEFGQLGDEQVADVLHRAAAPEPAALRDDAVEVPIGAHRLRGYLTVPSGARGLVVFAHGSGSGRDSPRNRYVALLLNRARLGTMLVDLLTEDEERERARVFDIPLLAERLGAVIRWARARPDGGALRIGAFGASTGAGAALWAAAEPGSAIVAVVSRGGRPDLAGPRLTAVRAPTLLIVGERDRHVLALNRQAQRLLHGPTRLVIVPRATHLFTEPGALQEAAEAARDWFVTHLGTPPPPGAPAAGASAAGTAQTGTPEPEPG